MMRSVAFGALVLHATATAQAKNELAVIPTQFDEFARGRVPELFDDYLLAAVQNNVEADVIGQDDIATLLGFEQQRDLLDCSDTSCIADIGGALGVDRIVSVKIALLEEDWVVTAKIINIRSSRVENRVNQIISGKVRDLLRAVPIVVAKLFGTSPRLSATTQPPRQAPPPAKAPEKEIDLSKIEPDPSFGRGRRLVGTIMLISGTAVTLIGGILLSIYRFDGDNTTVLSAAAGLATVGFLAQGFGAKIRATGVAQMKYARTNASGRPMVYVLSWILAGVSLGAPLFFQVAEIENDPSSKNPGTLAATWASGIGAITFFWLGAFVKTNPSISSLPVPTMQYARRPDGGGTPLLGLALRY